jgi:hypothetical protein
VLGGTTPFADAVDAALPGLPATIDKALRKGVRSSDNWGFVYTRSVGKRAGHGGHHDGADGYAGDVAGSGTTGLPKVCACFHVPAARGTD